MSSTPPTKLPADVLKFLWKKYYRWEHKTESDEAKEILVAHGYLDSTQKLPAEVQYLLTELACGGIDSVSAETVQKIQKILVKYGGDR